MKASEVGHDELNCLVVALDCLIDHVLGSHFIALLDKLVEVLALDWDVLADSFEIDNVLR